MNQIKLVRYGELIPCKTAFIDAHTPGSDQKENFTIIGGGVSESPDQHVHIKETPGFNIGAAGQPPKCRNSLHTHRTAEVFFVLSGRWRFFWGRWGTAGEVVLEEGDIFNIPTGIFRGFENIGTDYGMIMAILGGDDAGGGVVWAPQVIEEASQHGLVLAENGKLVDTAEGDHLADGVQAMRVLNEDELARFPEPPVQAIVPCYVARYWDLMALSAKQAVHVIGDGAIIQDTPGFDCHFLSTHSIPTTAFVFHKPEVYMVMRGHWTIECGGQKTSLAPGDTAWIPAGSQRCLHPSMSGEASLFRVRANDDPAGLTQGFIGGHS